MGKEKVVNDQQCPTARDERAIIRANSSLTARQIAEKAGITTNVSNVGRFSKNCEHLKRRKLQQKPWCVQEYKLHRNLQRNTFVRIRSSEESYLPMKRDSV